MKGGPFEDIEKIPKKKSHKAEKREESHSAKKVRNFCFGILVKKLAHIHGFEHEPSGLKNKHRTTRPRTPELCDMPAKMRVVARKKKHPHFPITLAYRKCNHENLTMAERNIVPSLEERQFSDKSPNRNIKSISHH